MNQEEQGKKMDQLVAKCWSDEGFKKKLLADPTTTLRAQGIEVPAGLSIKAMENTETLIHLVLPAKPTGKLLDEDLDTVAAAGNPVIDAKNAFCNAVMGMMTKR